jgi:Ca-activated chloride channel homolog
MSTRNLHSKIYWALLSFLILIVLWTLGALYASDAPSSPKDPKKEEMGVIRVDVNLVQTEISIIGKPTSELNKEDFIVYDDGVAQPVTLFSQDQLPIAVGLLIDASESTRPYMPVMQLAGMAALRHLRPEDKAVLYSFYGQVRRHTDLTNDFLFLVDAFDTINIQLGTRIYDAIIDASDYLNRMAPNSRRAIILISDDQNQNFGDRPNPERARISLLETSTTLYNVMAQSVSAPPNQESQESVVMIPRMVQETGGEYFDVRNPAGLQAALANAMVNIRKQYTLGFSPTNPGKPGTYHKLEVKLTSQRHCPGCVLRTRKGYYSGKTAPNPQRDVIFKPVRTAEETDELLVHRAILFIENNGLSPNDLPFNAQSAATTDGKLKVDLQIPAQRVAFRIEEGKYVAQLRIAIFEVKDARVLVADWKGLDLRLSEETYKKCLQSGIPFSTTIPKMADKGNIHAIIYDKGSDLVGTTTIRAN